MPQTSVETVIKEFEKHIRQKGVDDFHWFSGRINALPESERGNALKRFFSHVGPSLDPFAKGAISDQVKLSEEDRKEIEALLAEEVRYFV